MRDNQHVFSHEMPLAKIPASAGELTFRGLYLIGAQEPMRVTRVVRKAGETIVFTPFATPNAFALRLAPSSHRSYAVGWSVQQACVLTFWMASLRGASFISYQERPLCRRRASSLKHALAQPLHAAGVMNKSLVALVFHLALRVLFLEQAHQAKAFEPHLLPLFWHSQRPNLDMAALVEVDLAVALEAGHKVEALFADVLEKRMCLKSQGPHTTSRTPHNRGTGRAS